MPATGSFRYSPQTGRRPLGRISVVIGALAVVPFASCLGTRTEAAPTPAPELEPAPVVAAPAASEAPAAPADDVDIAALSEAEKGSWPIHDAEPAEPAVIPAAVIPSTPRRLDPDRALAAIAKETFVFSTPSWGAKKIGYLRAGAIVARKPHPAGHALCEKGWYAIEPDGFVCVGKTATLDLDHPIVKLSARRPDQTAALPYEYGMSTFPTPPFYTKLPSRRDQQRVEGDLAKHLARAPGKSWQAATLGEIPELLAGGAPLPAWQGGAHSPQSIYTGRAMVKSGFALLSLFESEGRRFGLSVDLDVLPLDRMQRIEPSAFRGLELNEEFTLPVVFTRSKYAELYEGSPATGLKPVRKLAFREALPITGKRVRIADVAYLEVKTGGWLRDSELVRVNPIKTRPGWATPGRTWIEVSILEQSLVAYEGEKPVFVTLVSTGADGLGDPKETHSTIRGQFLIHTKHVTTTMSGDEVGDEFDLREVPYVQYFTEGYAIHAAYWHDSFGRPRSHGCINLSPLDAKWLFHWTDPPVPEGWHGAMSLREGTLVHVHP